MVQLDPFNMLRTLQDEINASIYASANTEKNKTLLPDVPSSSSVSQMFPTTTDFLKAEFVFVVTNVSVWDNPRTRASMRESYTLQ